MKYEQDARRYIPVSDGEYEKARQANRLTYWWYSIGPKRREFFKGLLLGTILGAGGGVTLTVIAIFN